MEINALLMDAKDNVVTCVKEVKRGGQVVYRDGEEIRTLEAAEDIPYCHKTALAVIEKGEAVVKYGEKIGEADERIEKGRWVSHNNIHSVPRDYDSEMIETE